MRTPSDLKIALISLSLWLVFFIAMAVMWIENQGIDGILLQQPIFFFAVLASSIFLLATGLNHLIRYFQRK